MRDNIGTFILSTAPPDNLHLIPIVSGNNFLSLNDVDLGLAEGTSSGTTSLGSSASDYSLATLELRTTVVPLPAGLGLMLTALGATAFAARRSKRVTKSVSGLH